MPSLFACLRRHRGLFVCVFGLFCYGLTAHAADANPSPVAIVRDLAPLDAEQRSQLSIGDGTIKSVFNAQHLVEHSFTQASLPIPKGFGVLIHVVRWSYESNDMSKPVVANSNWYVYSPRDAGKDSGFAGRRRLYGTSSPYVLIMHLNAAEYGTEDPTISGICPDRKPVFNLTYQYKTTHRVAANISGLTSILSLFQRITEQHLLGGCTVPATGDFWAIGQIDGNPPSDINLIPAVTETRKSDGSAIAAADQKPMNLDTTETQFDNEGFYHWDVSIGVPITSYSQLQAVQTSNGTVPADVDKRNIVALFNWYIKPVDLQNPASLGIPHVAAGVSFASQPLHNIFAGLAWGPAIANFYIGPMIVTSNVAPNKKATHIKLGFGLNFPVRAITEKLGLKTQIE